MLPDSRPLPLRKDYNVNQVQALDLIDYALENGIIFRGEAPKHGSDGWFRVTIGSKVENRMAVKVLLEFFGNT